MIDLPCWYNHKQEYVCDLLFHCCKLMHSTVLALGVLGIVPMLFLSFHKKMHIFFAVLSLTAGSAGAAIADVTVDACVAQNSNKHQHLAPDMQSLCSLSSATGSLLGFFLSGLLVHFIGPKVHFFTSIMSLCIHIYTHKKDTFISYMILCEIFPFWTKGGLRIANHPSSTYISGRNHSSWTSNSELLLQTGRFSIFSNKLLNYTRKILWLSTLESGWPEIPWCNQSHGRHAKVAWCMATMSISVPQQCFVSQYLWWNVLLVYWFRSRSSFFTGMIYVIVHV